jgi:hypothetical protein
MICLVISIISFILLISALIMWSTHRTGWSTHRTGWLTLFGYDYDYDYGTAIGGINSTGIIAVVWIISTSVHVFF